MFDQCADRSAATITVALSMFAAMSVVVSGTILLVGGSLWHEVAAIYALAILVVVLVLRRYGDS